MYCPIFFSSVCEGTSADVATHDSSAICYIEMFTINERDIMKRLSVLNIYKYTGPELQIIYFQEYCIKSETKLLPHY